MNRLLLPAALHTLLSGPQVVERTAGYSGSDMRDLIQVPALRRCSLGAVPL